MNNLDPKYRKLAWEVARDSIVTKALARLLEQTVETIVTEYDHQRVTLEGEFLKLRERNTKLEAALSELADLMDDVVTGNYKPDSFTTQPARAALALQQSTEKP